MFWGTPQYFLIADLLFLIYVPNLPLAESAQYAVYLFRVYPSRSGAFSMR